MCFVMKIDVYDIIYHLKKDKNLTLCSVGQSLGIRKIVVVVIIYLLLRSKRRIIDLDLIVSILELSHYSL